MAKEIKHLQAPWLETWVDGTTIQSSFSGREGLDFIASGFAWQFHENFLSLLEKLVRASRESPNIINKYCANLLNECLIDLFLWGEGFSGGRLDQCIERSDSLKSAILGFIATGAKIMVNDLAPRFESGSSWVEISHASGELRTLVEKCDVILSEDIDSEGDDYNSDCDADSFNNSSYLAVSANNVKMDAQRLRSNVSCLMKLLPSMEHTLTLDDVQEDSSSPIEFQVSNAARSYVYNVHDKYRKAEVKLVSRLGEANFQRHVAVRQKNSGNKGPASFDITESVTYAPTSKFIPTSAFHDSGLGTVSAASIISHSSFRTDCSQSERSSFRVPPAPVDTFDNPFPCSICGNILKNIKSRYDWKVHVFSDLQPYICTFADCKDALRTFPTRKLWSDHEFSQHRVNVSWVCPVCGDDHKSTKNWEAHMDKVHPGSLTKIESRYALAAARRTLAQPIEQQKCPLCLKEAGSSRKAFTAHVCRHLESIALAALPNDATSDSEQSSVSSIQTSKGSRASPFQIKQKANGSFDFEKQVESSDLLVKVKMQLDYYFSVDNLSKDIYLRKHMNRQGWVLLKYVAGFKRIQALTQSYELIVSACLVSDVIDIARGGDGLDRLRKKHGWQEWVLAREREEWVLAREEWEESLRLPIPFFQHEDSRIPERPESGAKPEDNTIEPGNKDEMMAMPVSSNDSLVDADRKNSGSSFYMHTNVAEETNSTLLPLDFKTSDSSNPHCTPIEPEDVSLVYAPTPYTPVTGQVSRAKKGVPVDICNQCHPPKTFTRSEHLRRHQLSHQKPAHPCTFNGCERAFHRPDLLARHINRHETQDEPPYKPPRRQSVSEIFSPWLPSQAETPGEKSHDEPPQDISGFEGELPEAGYVPVHTESSINPEQSYPSSESLSSPPPHIILDFERELTEAGYVPVHTESSINPEQSYPSSESLSSPPPSPSPLRLLRIPEEPYPPPEMYQAQSEDFNLPWSTRASPNRSVDSLSFNGD